MDKGLGFDYYKKLFSQLSLSQLRDILYLIVPCASNFTYMKNGEFVETQFHANTLAHVKIIIKYIEKEMFIASNDIIIFA